MSVTESSDPVARARRYVQDGRLADAVELLSPVVESDADNADALALLGMALGRLGNAEASVAALRRAAELRPDDTRAAYNLAVALSRAGSMDEARAQFELVLQADPQNERARAALASLNRSVPQAPDPASTVADIRPDSLGRPAPPAAQPLPVPSSPGGMRPPTMIPETAAAPGAGVRVLRGLGWGPVCGQIWTGWFMFWALVWQGTKLGGVGIGILAVLCVLFFGFAGGATGLVVGLSRADRRVSSIIGGVFGLLLCAVEMALGGSATMIVNVLFWWFTGQAVGGAIGARVNAPVAARPGS